MWCILSVMEEIRWISLNNKAGFTVKIRVHGNSANYEPCGYYPVCQEKVADLADAVGIKDGEVVWLEAVPSVGSNCKAKERFIYRKSSNKRACYSIKGVTVKKSLSYNGLVDEYIKIAEPIRGFTLRNNGAFVAHIRIKSNSGSYNYDHDICLKQEQTLDLSQTYGKIKDGDEVWLEAVVVGGGNNTGKQRFVYRKSSETRAIFTISGTLWINSISYNGTQRFITKITEPIRFITLKNTGGFVARVRIHGGSSSYNFSNDICVTQEKRFDLADAFGTIKNGDEIWLETVVRGGANKTAPQRFVFQRTADSKACYTISGSTQINSLSYQGVFKVGVLPSTPATFNGITNKISDWNNKRTACAWPGINKSEVVNGLKKIADCYFNKSQKYTSFFWLGKSGTTVFSGVDQGSGFQTCGPVAVMFSLVKLNISTFIDVITTLYETGSLMGYKVPGNLRNLESNTNKIENKYPCSDNDLANVCWMFQASLAQKESLLDIVIDAAWSSFDRAERAIRMHTRHDEMEDDVNYVFNAMNVKHQGLITWSTTSKALNNLDEWIQYLNNSGVVLWMIHSDALKNLTDGKNRFYTHVDVHDLHWVAVTNVQKTATNITIDLHSWGKLYRITVSHSTFQAMSYLAVLFKIKP